MVKILVLFVLAYVVTSCESFLKEKPTPSKMIVETVHTYELQKEETEKSLRLLTESPHPMGSDRQIQVRDHLITRLKELNLIAKVQSFEVETPHKKAGDTLAPLTLRKNAFNVSVSLGLLEKPTCLVALASHYDTKDIEDFPYVGANDGGSSTVLLLDLTRFLLKNKEKLKVQCDVEVIWFDGEEAVLSDWNDGVNKHPSRIIDNTYGSRRYAQDLVPCSSTTRGEFLGLLLLDMVGYADLQLTMDQNSDPYLRSLLLSANEFLNKNLVNLRFSQAVADDHLPFKERGIATLNMIDFNHLAFWHTPLDRFDTVSMDSLESSGKLALYILLSMAANPEPLRKKTSNLCFP